MGVEETKDSADREGEAEEMEAGIQGLVLFSGMVRNTLRTLSRLRFRETKRQREKNQKNEEFEHEMF